MCGPEATLATQAFGSIGTALGTYAQKEGEQASFEATAKIANVNARLAELTAQSATSAGQKMEQAQRLKTAQLKSSQRAGYAAQGIDLGSQTVARVGASTDVMGEIDASTIKSNAARSAWGYRTQGINFKNQALLAETAADNISPFQDAGSTLLTGASSVMKNRYKFQTEGLLPKDDWLNRNFGI